MSYHQHYTLSGASTVHNPQLRSARLYIIAQQRSAAQCGAVPCPSFFCGAASCVSVRSFEHTAAVTSSSSSTRYDTDTRFMYVFGVYSSFCFLQMIVLSRSPCMCPPPRKYRTYYYSNCRSERDINKHTAQRRAISSVQAPTSHGIILELIFKDVSREFEEFQVNTR